MQESNKLNTGYTAADGHEIIEGPAAAAAATAAAAAAATAAAAAAAAAAAVAMCNKCGSVVQHDAARLQGACTVRT